MSRDVCCFRLSCSKLSVRRSMFDVRVHPLLFNVDSKRERSVVPSVSFASSVRCSAFGVQCSMFAFIFFRSMFAFILFCLMLNGRGRVSVAGTADRHSLPRSRNQSGLDECHQFPECLAQLGIVLTDSVEITAGIVRAQNWSVRLSAKSSKAENRGSRFTASATSAPRS